MNSVVVSFVLIVVSAEPPAGPPRDSKPEFGFGLTVDDAAKGRIALFDGKTTFGWTKAEAKDGVLVGGATTASFGPLNVRAEAASAGTMQFGGRRVNVMTGSLNDAFRETGPIALIDGLGVKKLDAIPVDLEKKFNGKDLTGWKELHHPTLAASKRPKWSVKDGVTRAVGGPGAIELQERFADFVLQVEVRTAKMANGGVFFRADPGSFMNGYEAQIYNGCYDGDPAKPCRYSTGAIDDRQLARRLVSRDGEWFTMTVIASGPHIATWVNGHQMTDWTDTRAKDTNPRKGLRLEAGTIQLQAHDPETDVEFRNLRIAEIKAAK